MSSNSNKKAIGFTPGRTRNITKSFWRIYKYESYVWAFFFKVSSSSISLQNLFEYLNQKHNLEYILTIHLNQDALESFFSQLRICDGLNNHPTPLNVLYRIPMMILRKISGIVLSSSNTVDIKPDKFLMAILMKTAMVIIIKNELI